MAGEKNFENRVKNYLKKEGAWFLKTYSNGIQRSGVPDLLIGYRGRFIGMEVKAKDGRFNDELQPLNIKEINDSGNIAGVLIPAEGKERFRRYVAKHWPQYIDTPIYDFDDFKQLIEKIKSESI